MQLTTKIDLISALSINIVLLILYYKFLVNFFGHFGIAFAYVIAFAACVYIYRFRNKEYLVDATLGFFCVIAMIYFLMYKKSWQLFAMEMIIIIIVFSISTFYFDWKKLDKR